MLAFYTSIETVPNKCKVIFWVETDFNTINCTKDDCQWSSATLHLETEMFYQGLGVLYCIAQKENETLIEIFNYL